MYKFYYQTHPAMVFLLYFAIYLFLLLVIGEIITQMAKTTSYKAIAQILVTILTVIMLVTGSDITIFFEINPMHLITIFYPPIVLKIVYELDLSIFREHLSFSVAYAILMSAAFSTCLGFAMLLLTGAKWSLMLVPIYGFALGSIDYLDSTVSVLNLTSYKSLLLVLIQVESVIGAEVCYTSMQISVAIMSGSLSSWYQVVTFYLRKYIGGMVLGFIAGRILQCVIELFLDNVHNMALFIILTPISVFFIGEHVFYVSSGVAVLIYAYYFAMYKTRIPIKVSRNLDRINSSISRIAQSLLIYFAAVPLVVRTIQHFDIGMLMEYLGLFIMVVCLRFILLLCFIPAFNFTKRTHIVSNVIFMILFAKRGPVQMVYFLMILSDSNAYRMGCFCAPHTYFLITISLLINPEMLALMALIFGVNKKELDNYNIATCLKKFEEVESNFVSMLRMNTGYADVNWKFVLRTMKLSLLVNDGIKNQPEPYESRQSYCKTCKKVVIFEPTRKKYNLLMIEAKKTINLAHKRSFVTQYETGRFQKHVITILLNFVEYSMASPDLSLDPMLFKHFIHKETMIFKIKSCMNKIDLDTTLHRPRKQWRNFFFKIVVHFVYEWVLMIVLLCSITLMIMDIFKEGKNEMIFILKCVVAFIFFSDFVLKIISYSHILFVQAFQRYFKNVWDQFDFLVMIILCLDIVLVHYISNLEKSLPQKMLFYTVKSVVAIQVFKIAKVMFILKRFENVIMKFLDKWIGLRIMLAVDIGEAMIRSYDEVIHAMPKLVENESICAELTQKAKNDRIIIKSQLINRTAERDWVMVTCKTRLVIRNCFFAMKRKIFEMWTQGYIDDFEHAKLKQSQEIGLQNFLKLKTIQKQTDEEAVFNLGFMLNDSIRYFCYVNSFKIKFEKNDVIMRVGNTIDSLMIMTSGLVRVVYEPTDVELYAHCGALPGIDDIGEDTLFQPKSYFMMCGSQFGDMGVLTQRPYHCHVVALETSEFIIIPIEIIRKAARRLTDDSAGVHSLMWTHFTLKLINGILWKTKPFLSWTEEEIMGHTVKGFFPDLTDCSSFERPRSVEDIIIVEGIAQDAISSVKFIAPCHLPRHVQFINLIRKDKYMVNPQLFFIPLDASLYDSIMTTFKSTFKKRDDYDKEWTHGLGHHAGVTVREAKGGGIMLSSGTLPKYGDDWMRLFYNTATTKVDYACRVQSQSSIRAFPLLSAPGNKGLEYIWEVKSFEKDSDPDKSDSPVVKRRRFS
ncbi:sodium/hydrogen exchanger 11-like isoform X2 [Atheta coriaria]|uniref:sodium/hydrogen exchanger 11-like isoform X2 n=1 Tax=Dalotia coriaria TaxID=877792 RepID=UPI0031F45EF2